MNNKDIEEIKIKKAFTYLNSLKSIKLFQGYFSPSKSLSSIYKYNKLLLKQDLNDKCSNKSSSYYYKDKKNNLDKSLKSNIKKEEISKCSKKCENSNTKDTNTNNNNKNNKKSAIDKLNNKNSKNIEIYGQTYDLKMMRESPPKSPELFFHLYTMNNKRKFFKENDSFGIIKNDKIPNIFYNHFLFTEKKYILNCRYKKISMTNRNKNKLLTIIYCSP